MEWGEVPRAVRNVIERHTGPVTATVDVTAGSASDLSCTVRPLHGGEVFCKGVAGRSRRMRWLRNEITGNLAAATIAPRVLFHADIDAADAGEDWLVVGYEYVPGRPASLAPGSPDLPLVAAAVEQIAATAASGLRPLSDRWSPTDWWVRLAEIAPEAAAGFDIGEMTRLSALVPNLVAGDRLLHTDLHGDQFVIGDHGIRVLDWGFPGSGAPWVDTAFMTLRLIEAGHSPHAAETWARGLATFADVDDETLTAFAAYIAGFWSHIAATDGPGSPRRARLARAWAAWRLGRRLAATG